MKLDAFVLTVDSIVTLAPAPARREWMEKTPQRFANRCLPLMMANQAGWHVSLTEAVEAEWSGNDAITEITVTGGPRVKENVTSHFGSGVLTFKLPFLFRLAEGYNLLVRGPPNLPKDGIAPLEGLVEADWAISPFTMNWKFTRAKHRVRFEAGEPVALLVPERRHALEKFDPLMYDLDDDPDLAADYREWRQSRDSFIGNLHAREEEAVKEGWQRDYFLGRGPGDTVAKQHQTKLSLRSFRRRLRVQ
jgi:Family of unknown function (DUF6065)